MNKNLEKNIIMNKLAIEQMKNEIQATLQQLFLNDKIGKNAFLTLAGLLKHPYNNLPEDLSNDIKVLGQKYAAYSLILKVLELENLEK